MIWQADHQVRHVYLGVKHSGQVKPSWYGESIGHYEGDTLVVDTIGLDTRTAVDNFQTPHSPQLHVIERFHMINNGNVLEANVHVEDPGAFTTPWNAIQSYRRLEPGRAENNEPFNPVSSSDAAGPMLEASCAENNECGFLARAHCQFRKPQGRISELKRDFPMLAMAALAGVFSASADGQTRRAIPAFASAEFGWLADTEFLPPQAVRAL